MPIDIQQARALFLKKTLARYDEMIPESNFLQSLFRVDTGVTLDVSIEIRRGKRNIAVEVQRGGGSNANNFTKSSERIYRPPMYSEENSVNAMDGFNVLFGQENFSAPNLARLATDNARKMADMRNKISRAKEKQCSEVLLTGTVTTKYADIIDYKRDASSLIDIGVAHGYWSSATAKIADAGIQAATFIRQKGNSAANQFDWIMRGSVFEKLKATNYYSVDANRNDRANLNDIKRPIARTGGSFYHGTITFGSFIAHLWTYDETYLDADGADQYYLPADKVIVLPVDHPDLILAHAGISIIGANKFPVPVAGEYVIREAIDYHKVTYSMFVESAPLAVSYMPDKIVTMTVLDEGGVG